MSDKYKKPISNMLLFWSAVGVLGFYGISQLSHVERSHADHGHGHDVEHHDGDHTDEHQGHGDSEHDHGHEHGEEGHSH